MAKNPRRRRRIASPKQGVEPTATGKPARAGRGVRYAAFAIVAAMVAAGVTSWFRQEPATPPQATAVPASISAAPGSTAGAAAEYVGREACAECHAAETTAWSGSHHDLAMQEATDATVLGNFDNATYDDGGVISTFFRADGRFMVRTDGADGALAELEVRHTFGVSPLQQYLVELPAGHVQALPLAWDTRPAGEGGQRWFHMYPSEQIRSDDELHWTRAQQNWNFMCAECHSTNVEKNYDAARRSYATTFSEIDVSCEACHGPASAHVTWARSGARDAEDRGLLVKLDERRGVTWRYDTAARRPVRSKPRESARELDACAQCHSRRGQVWAHEPGRSIGDSHRIATLDAALYWPDGQIRDEVYEYGSFLQSRMSQQGVTCSDCHDPHSLTLRAPGNGVCLQCHAAADYANPAHHHHAPDSQASACVECHMPARTYMVVDPRRDHSLKIPRPDLSAEIGTPNACTACHAERSPAWAAQRLDEWFGKRWRERPSAAPALHAGNVRAPDARTKLLALAADLEMPGITRASALERLDRITNEGQHAELRTRLNDADPLVRRAAVRAYDLLPPDMRLDLIAVLADPVRDVRLEAVPRVMAIDAAALSGQQLEARRHAQTEYVASQRLNADRAESHLNLGLLAATVGDTVEAEAALEQALVIDDRFAPAAVNLADLHRSLAREQEAERVLRGALVTNPNVGALHHALGLLLVRTGRQTEALVELARAAELDPDAARYSYVYAVALAESGDREKATETLTKSLGRHPNDREALAALANYLREAGDAPRALTFARQLVALEPDDREAVALLAALLPADASRPEGRTSTP